MPDKIGVPLHRGLCQRLVRGVSGEKAGHRQATHTNKREAAPPLHDRALQPRRRGSPLGLIRSGGGVVAGHDAYQSDYAGADGFLVEEEGSIDDWSQYTDNDGNPYW